MNGSTARSVRVDPAREWVRERWPELLVAGVVVAWFAFVVWRAATLSSFGGSDPEAFVARSQALADAVRAGRGVAYAFSSIDPPLRYVPFALVYLIADPGAWAATRLAVVVVGLASLVATPLLWFGVARRLIDDRTGAAFVVCWSALVVLGGLDPEFPLGAWQYAVATPVGVGVLAIASRDDWSARRVGAGVGVLAGVAAMVQSGVALTAALFVGTGWVIARRWRRLAWAAGVGTATVSPMFAFAATYTSRAGGMGPDILLSLGDVPATPGAVLWRLTLSPMVPAALLAVLAVGVGYSFDVRVERSLLRGGLAVFAPVAVLGNVGPLEWYYFFYVASHLGIPLAVLVVLDQGRSVLERIDRVPVGRA